MIEPKKIEPKKQDSGVVHIRLDNALLRRVRELAWAESRTVSGVVIYAIKKYFKII